jgi:hypothetical protein
VSSRATKNRLMNGSCRIIFRIVASSLTMGKPMS